MLTPVAAEWFKGALIIMVEADGSHSVALGTNGRVWTWGLNIFGQLGHNNKHERLVPTQLAGEALGGSAVILVVAGGWHTMAKEGLEASSVIHLSP